MNSQNNKSVTLIEILIVIIIIAILIALFLPHFSAMRERALDKEAQTNLRLIQAAERIYRLETGHFFPYEQEGEEYDTYDINSNLNLSLSPRNWDYSIAADDDDKGDTFDAQAVRSQFKDDESHPWYRIFSINQEPGSEPTCTGNGCPE